MWHQTRRGDETLQTQAAAVELAGLSGRRIECAAAVLLHFLALLPAPLPRLSARRLPRLALAADLGLRLVHVYANLGKNGICLCSHRLDVWDRWMLEGSVLEHCKLVNCRKPLVPDSRPYVVRKIPMMLYTGTAYSWFYVGVPIFGNPVNTLPFLIRCLHPVGITCPSPPVVPSSSPYAPIARPCHLYAALFPACCARRLSWMSASRFLQWWMKMVLLDVLIKFSFAGTA
ncbi:hypothetical protein MUK42_27771 [Musa troglodytarum]|uniref:Uncharacterized protein n=1 Tax=Musa troglodytarum TaxID=320322 RepID=A0A9E7EZE5_9LILI|nr:hypothetical protein MUK42_27771 [Musa troglodytarum]URD85283.1 hypothetical protein MUK42_27771 [Musa troglodytarum]